MNASATGDGRGPGPAQPGLLRSLNNRVVLELLIEHGTLSRTDVHTLTGLSKPTASQLLQRLEESGLVRPSGFGDTGPGGRAPQLYRIDPTVGYGAALDVRRDLVRMRILDITGAVVLERTAETDTATSGPGQVAALLETSLADAGIDPGRLDAVVVSVPGSYDADTDTLWYVDQLPGWQQVPVGSELRQRFPAATIAIENDVNLAAIAEQRASGEDGASFFLFWLDDGIGGAIMVNGSLYRGSRGAAGEAAFLFTPGATLDAASREGGALERLVGVEAVRRLAADAGHRADTATDALQAILDDVGPDAAAAFSELAHRYALALASVIALLDPERLVLAGELARLGGERLRAEVVRRLDGLVLTAPPIVCTVASSTPILDGAALMSLDVARDRVFTT